MWKELSFQENRKLTLSVCIILVVHFFGVLGMSIGYKDWFLQFTPINLLLTTFLLFFNNTESSPRLYLSFLLIFVSGLMIEIVGVKTGFPFGSYYYGNSLGWKYQGVPFIIGINWAALCLASAITVNQFFENNWIRIIIGALLPLLVDVFIEGVCDKLDFWYWKEGIIPMQNYLTWFICSFFFVGIFSYIQGDKTNLFAKYFLLIQFLFFVILNFTLN